MYREWVNVCIVFHRLIIFSLLSITGDCCRKQYGQDLHCDGLRGAWPQESDGAYEGTILHW